LIPFLREEKSNDSDPIDPGQSKEVSLIDHDPLSGIAKKDLDILVKEGKTQTFPLARFYD
jgi:hypothetical protein